MTQLIRETLKDLDRLDAQAHAADEAVQRARTQLAAAQAAVRQAEADAATLRRDLHQTRDPLVALGAPAVDGSQLLAAWTRLTDWAATQANTRRQALPGAQAADDAAQTALRVADKALTDAQTQAAQARKAETDATGSHERARAALKGLQTRLGELTAALFGAPTERDAQAQLAQIDELTAAATTADAAFQRARTAREQAEDAAKRLTARWPLRGRGCARLGTG